VHPQHHRHHNCFDRTQLGTAIQQAFTFRDTQEPAKVVHWNSLANVSEWLSPYTADFAKNCMKYRHLRFFRSRKTSTVWLQAASRMNSWGDPTDEWRGLAPLSTHTDCFPTQYGIPNIFEAHNQAAFPDSQQRQVNMEEHAAVVKGMHAIKAHFDCFTEANLADCLDMLSLYTDDARPFEWNRDDIKLLYGAGTGIGASQDVAVQQSQGLPVGAEGEVFLCRPAAEDEDTFIVGIIRGITRHAGYQGVNMQWFTLTNPDACKYTSMYTSVLPANTR
jgi:hypothetical protein